MRFYPKICLLLSFAIVFLVVNQPLKAGPGDTITVQTFTYGSPQNAWFNFPSDTMRYEKVLMYHTLKCVPGGAGGLAYPCGEWDYLTYNFLWDHTGDYDSTVLNQNSYVIDGASPATYGYTNTQAWTYVPRWEYFNNVTGTISFDSAIVGAGVTPTIVPFSSGNPDARSQYLWTASELSTAGLVAGPITDLRFFVSAAGSEMRMLTIKMKNSALATLSATTYETALTTAYSQNTQLTASGWNNIHLQTPITWDGVSNLAVEICYDNLAGGVDNTIMAGNAGFDACLTSNLPDSYLDFEGADFVEVPPAALSGISDEITVSFWQYGDPAFQPQDDYAFEGRDAAGNRVINVHLPWSNGDVYWDCGNSGSGSYDRINKTAATLQYEGQWNHWAFTKNATSGEMKMYLNGVLFHSGTGLNRTLSPITRFRIGSHANTIAGGGFYDGYIDEFRIWDKALGPIEIANWMNKDVDVTHPDYANLKAYYKFNEGNGGWVQDAGPGGFTAGLSGMPAWQQHNGCDRWRNFTVNTTRPNVVFGQGVYTQTLDSMVVIDSFPVPVTQILVYNDSAMLPLPSDTLYGWAPWVRYEFDAVGNVTPP